MRNQLSIAVAGCLLLSVAGAALAEGAEHAIGRNPADMKFVTFPGLPDCSVNAVQSGDPAKGASVILGRIKSGCTVPWHWHTPTEQLMMVSGTARIETKDAKPFVLKAGGFAELPPRHVHQFRCVSACVMYVHADGPFDIHYVDGKGNEIAPDAALTSVRKAAAR